MTALYSPLPLELHRVDDTGDLILHDPQSGAMAVLNPVGAAIFELLDGSRHVEDIAELLAEAFPAVPPVQLERDVRAFLADLANRGLIRCSEG